ncbi:MAG: hypothetical protein BWY01_00527 [Synergistetes bacterium ADurb.Bin155]|jgi:hypothetical protein|nr:aconitase X catalytic domain-containing protein [Synergistales bacterium]MBP8996010.1 aconitase X catalytic domain-containing protein [Synergistales bacterium]OQB46617.1 MAG: hypothetical protein BWY01_00527 [Synergistetes bacterium ADurb.Bin155]
MPVRLNRFEEEMLHGKYGEGVSLAMRVLVGIGETFDAERLVDITRAHVSSSSQDADIWFAEKMADLGTTCRVPPTLNPNFDFRYIDDHLFETPEKGKAMITATNEAYKKLGAIPILCCTPYFEQNVPGFGEIVAFSESNATVYVNSVIGARTNRESAQSALCAAITGKVPEYGLLLEENRRGEVLVEVEADIRSDFDFQLLGWCYPLKHDGFEIPVFTGLKEKPSPEALMNFGTQLNTTGVVPMYHIVGVTPEAPTLEAALGGDEVKAKVTITKEDIEKTRAEFYRKPGKIDFAMLGCPHLTLSQVAEISRLLEGKRSMVPIILLTNSLTREMAQRMGYLKVIQRAGGHLIPGTCVDIPSCWAPFQGKTGVTDSPRCAYYNELLNITFNIMPIEKCIGSAVLGEVVE